MTENTNETDKARVELTEPASSTADTSPEPSSSSRSARFDDTDLWRKHIHAMVPTIEFGTTGAANDMDILRNKIVELYQEIKGKNVNRYDGLIIEPGEEEPVDEMDNTHLRSMSPLTRLEAFVFAAFMIDELRDDKNLMLMDMDLRRALGAISSLRAMLRERTSKINKIESVEKKRQRDIKLGRRLNKKRIDSLALEFYNNKEDMRDLIYTSDDKIKHYDVLERMYRMARQRESLATQDAAANRETAELYKNRLRSLERTHYRLLEDLADKATADRWEKLYRARIAKSNEKRKEQRAEEKKKNAAKAKSEKNRRDNQLES